METKIHEDAVAVVTRLHQPLRYPTGCPDITLEMMSQPEKTGPGWLPHGRAAFIHGLMMGTIPRTPADEWFSSYLFGGHASQEAMERDEPAFKVILDADTGSVSILRPELCDCVIEGIFANSDNEQDSDGRRYPDDIESSFSERPLIQSPDGSKAWDQLHSAQKAHQTGCTSPHRANTRHFVCMRKT